jgi:putative intracellular protease/amidase
VTASRNGYDADTILNRTLLPQSDSERHYLMGQPEEIEMTKIVTVLTDGFADWETSLLNAVARGFYGTDTAYATLDGMPVVSMGGMKVAPDLALGDLDAAGYDALIVCGGGAWEQEDPPDIGAALKKAAADGKVVAGICAGSYQLAKAGLLDAVAHTSNARADLDKTGYRGGSHYRDAAEAVRDGKLVTAAGVSPVSFMAKVMEALGLSDGNLDYYVGLHAAQHGSAQKVAA